MYVCVLCACALENSRVFLYVCGYVRACMYFCLFCLSLCVFLRACAAHARSCVLSCVCMCARVPACMRACECACVWLCEYIYLGLGFKLHPVVDCRSHITMFRGAWNRKYPRSLFIPGVPAVA